MAAKRTDTMDLHVLSGEMNRRCNRTDLWRQTTVPTEGLWIRDGVMPGCCHEQQESVLRLVAVQIRDRGGVGSHLVLGAEQL